MKEKTIFILQILTLSVVWIIVLGIIALFVHLVIVAHRLHDALTAAVGISIFAIVVFCIMGSVATYVFIGFQKDKNEGGRL